VPPSAVLDQYRKGVSGLTAAWSVVWFTRGWRPVVRGTIVYIFNFLTQSVYFSDGVLEQFGSVRMIRLGALKLHLKDGDTNFLLEQSFVCEAQFFL